MLVHICGYNMCHMTKMFLNTSIFTVHSFTGEKSVFKCILLGEQKCCVSLNGRPKYGEKDALSN